MGFRGFVGLCVVLSASTSRAGFDTTAKVGSAKDAGGTYWACVVKNATTIRCGYGTSASNFSWCTNEYSLAGNLSMASLNGGIYLVQNFTSRQLGGKDIYGIAFATVLNSSGVGCSTSGCYEILRLYLTTTTNAPTCVYAVDDTGARYMSGSTNPDLSPTLALAEDSAAAPAEYVFSVVPSSDANAAGAIMGVKIPNQGFDPTTSWTWQYASGSMGIISPHLVDSSSPISATKSSLSGSPLVVVRDYNGGTTTVMTAAYLEGTTWKYSAGNGLAGDSVGNGLAVAAVPGQVSGGTRYGDSLFTVGTAANGDLWEDKFTCTDNGAGGCNANSFGLTGSVWKVGNSGNPNDAGNSLAASYYYDNGNAKYWATAYTRIDDTHAETAKTDYIGASKTWSALIPGNSGWVSGDLFKGVQSNVRDTTNSKDVVFGACKDSAAPVPNYYLCMMARAWGSTTFDWTLKTY